MNVGSLVKKLPVLISLLTALSCQGTTHIGKNTAQLSTSGGEGSGGGDPFKIDKTVVQLLIDGDDLKNAMLNYLKTLPLDNVSDLRVLQTIMKDGSLAKDIRTSKYFAGPACKDELNLDVPASTELGTKNAPNLGGSICFDVDLLTSRYQGLSKEELMIQMASLAFHEHIHHFQDRNGDKNANEKEAYLVAAYVQLTAKVLQIPLLKWAPPSCNDSSINLRTVEVGFRCVTSKGATFTRIEREFFGEAWKDSDGVIWSDIVGVGNDSNVADAKAICEKFDAVLPNNRHFERGEAMGFREVLPNVENKIFWSADVDSFFVSRLGEVHSGEEHYANTRCISH